MTALSLKALAGVYLAFIVQHEPPGKDPVQTVDSDEMSEVYDFIIVGAGSAGSALANRLSEIPEWTILLLEAGQQETVFSRTPAIWTTLGNTEYDWNYTTTDQHITCQATQGRCFYPRGKVLGGSSSINGMIYTRGYRSDYDKWGAANPGWSFNDVRPYFLKSEGSRIRNSVAYGKHGPITVNYATFRTPMAEPMIQAAMSTGMIYADCANNEVDCVERLPSTIRDGRRCSTSTAYLEPISRSRSNLHIITGAEVTRVITKNSAAIGVEFSYRGKVKSVLSRKEVIISAGAINTPKILMLSGIGPKEHLHELRIPVVEDLPVGNNLQDHFRVPMFFTIDDHSVVTTEDLADPNVEEEYLRTQTGPYSYNGGEALAWVKVGNASDGAPNIQYHLVTLSIDEVYRSAIFTTVARPESRGTVRLNVTDPMGQPLINVNYYGDKHDWNTALLGLQHAYNLFQTQPLASLGATLDFDLQPMCKEAANLNDYFDCIIRAYTVTMYHPVGTAKMAARSDNGVVNPSLQVYGVKNLRVIDASIAPTIVSMNTNAMAIMIGEKGADIIKRFYGRAKC